MGFVCEPNSVAEMGPCRMLAESGNALPSTFAASKHFIPYSCAVTRGYHNERKETDQLNAKEGKPNRHEPVCLHMRYVNQRLAHTSDQDEHGQVVNGGCVDTKG
ncbi:hypothetical protein D3C84_926030 [compost metagenome]